MHKFSILLCPVILLWLTGCSLIKLGDKKTIDNIRLNQNHFSAFLQCDILNKSCFDITVEPSEINVYLQNSLVGKLTICDTIRLKKHQSNPVKSSIILTPTLSLNYSFIKTLFKEKELIVQLKGKLIYKIVGTHFRKKVNYKIPISKNQLLKLLNPF